MITFKTNILIIAGLLLCGSASAAVDLNTSVEDFPDWKLKRYMPEPSLTRKLISLETDYFADHAEAQSKIFMEISKKLRSIKERYMKNSSAEVAAENYLYYLDNVAIFYSGIKGALGEPLEDPIIAVNMLRQLIYSDKSAGVKLFKTVDKESGNVE